MLPPDAVRPVLLSSRWILFDAFVLNQCLVIFGTSLNAAGSIDLEQFSKETSHRIEDGKRELGGGDFRGV